jgi:biotin-(acetyl-CoA carboxylase) ligase
VAERYVGLLDLISAPQPQPAKQPGTALQPGHTLQAQQALQQSLLQAVLKALQAHYIAWKQNGLAATLAAWHAADALKGQLVRIRAPGGTIEGTACGLAADGRLQVQTTQGQVFVLAGEVEQLEAQLPYAPQVLS